MTNLQTQISNHKWKKCLNCDGTGKTASYRCSSCKGSGFELMEIENPVIIKLKNTKFTSSVLKVRKYKEGEIIEIISKEPLVGEFPKNIKVINRKYKFQIIKTSKKTGWALIPIGGN